MMASHENLSLKRPKLDTLNDVLPEDVVRHILSRLPTKEAIKTSILSIRWRFLWTGISNLDFSDENEVNLGYGDEFGNYIRLPNMSGVHREKFINNVSSVLSRLDPTNSVDKFSISLEIFPELLEVEKWISWAVEHKVKDISLSLVKSIKGCCTALPLTVFGCKSLEALRLYFGLKLKFPQQKNVCFPNLKFLSLEKVLISDIPDEKNSPCFPKLKNLYLHRVVYDGKDDCVMKLIRNCPLLEDLWIDRYLQHDVSNVDMCIPQLTTVGLDCGLLKQFCEGLSVHIESPVKYLTISNWNPTNKITVKNPDSLIRAELVFRKHERYNYQGEQQNELLKLFNTVKKVECLVLSHNVSDAIKASMIKLPLLCNVTRLEVRLNCKDFRMLECFLNSTKNLQILVIGIIPWCRIGENGRCRGEDERWTELLNVPKCMITSLKNVEILCATDCPGELDMIKHVLEYAKVLEKLTTSPYYVYERRNIDSLHRKISQFERASASCQIDVLQSLIPMP